LDEAGVVACTLARERTTREAEALVRRRARSTTLRRVVAEHRVERAASDAAARERDAGLAFRTGLRDAALELLRRLLRLQLVLARGRHRVANGELLTGRLQVQARLLVLRFDRRVLLRVALHHARRTGRQRERCHRD